MKHYSAFAIEQFTKYINNETEAFNWLVENNYRELIATLDAIRDDKNAFKFLIESKYFILAAFSNAIWDDEKAFKFLIDQKAFDWAAAANMINGDEKAEMALNTHGKKHYAAMAHAIQARIREDGDRAVSGFNVIKNIFNYKQAIKTATKKDDDESWKDPKKRIK